jgi:hypothetical protein
MSVGLLKFLAVQFAFLNFSGGVAGEQIVETPAAIYSN